MKLNEYLIRQKNKIYIIPLIYLNICHQIIIPLKPPYGNLELLTSIYDVHIQNNRIKHLRVVT